MSSKTLFSGRLQPLWAGRRVQKGPSPSDTTGTVKVLVSGPQKQLHVPSMLELVTQAIVLKQPAEQRRCTVLFFRFSSLGTNLREAGFNLADSFRFLPWSLGLCFLVYCKAEHHCGQSVPRNNFFIVDKKQRKGGIQEEPSARSRPRTCL